MHRHSLLQHKVVLRAEVASTVSFYKKHFGLAYAIKTTTPDTIFNLKDIYLDRYMAHGKGEPHEMLSS